MKEAAFDPTSLVAAYRLGDLVACEATAGGISGAAFRLETSRGTYLLKREVDQPWADLYSEVEQALNAAGVRQARLLTTVDGQGRTPAGCAVLEWLPGAAREEIDDGQLLRLLTYMADYHRALRPIAAPAWVRTLRNPWDQADSLDFLFDRLPALRPRLPLSPPVDRVLQRGLDFLEEFRPAHAALPKQLVHGDAGPGNALFDGDKVVAIIDFTPYHESHLYAVAITLYWSCIYFTGGEIDWPRLRAGLRRYAAAHGLTPAERRAWPGLLTKAAMRMLVVLLLFELQTPVSFPPEHTVQTAAILEQVLDAQTELGTL